MSYCISGGTLENQEVLGKLTNETHVILASIQFLCAGAGYEG